MRRQIYIKAFIIATAIALGTRFFFIESFRISSSSMYPALWEGDLVFVSKSDFSLRIPFSTFEIIKFRTPRRGEVVAFSLPDRGSATFIKRVVGLAGDTVQIRGGILYVNNAAAQYQERNGFYEEKLPDARSYLLKGPPAGTDYGPVLVPESHFFALGDNRADSVDSREWGPVPNSYLKGSVWRVWLSLDRSGKVRAQRQGLPIHAGPT